MTVSNAIKFVIHSQLNHKMLGRKRLHKLLLLGSIAADDHVGEDILSEAEFYIHHYGVYSKTVAKSLDELVFEGSLIKKSEALGVFDSLVDTYEQDTNCSSPSEKFDSAIETLSSRNTILLEVAANVAFHFKKGKSLATAKEETELLKPVKSERYMDDSISLLREVGILE